MPKPKRVIEESIGVIPTETLKEAIASLNSVDEEQEEELSTEEIKEELEIAKQAKKTIKSYDVPDLIERTEEVDEISNRAEKYFEDMMDKAFNSQDKHAAELFNAATALLKTALDAKKAIIDAHVKAEDLRIKEKKVDNSVDPKNIGAPSQVVQTDNGTVITDRNTLRKKKDQ